MVRFKRNDTVLVRTGKDKGKKGKILRIFPENQRALVEGINMVKKHMRPTRDNPKGGIFSMESPIHSTNIMLVCARCSKPTKVGYKFLTDGTKKRMCKKCHEIM